MSIFSDLLLVALVTIYIVDISGFTDSWRSLLARLLHIRSLRPLPPFDCGKCATFWACIIYAATQWQLTLPVVAFASVLSFLSVPIGGAMIFIREWMNWLIDKLSPRWR